jgi:hypothetical protein
VGFNPFRKQEKTALDIFMMVFAVVATLGAIVWAVSAG